MDKNFNYKKIRKKIKFKKKIKKIKPNYLEKRS
jgi:hypothetical protein